MNYFYIASEVRWTMAETEWPEDDEFQDLLQAYKRAFQDKSRGTRVTDIFRELLPLHVENELLEVFNEAKDSLLLDRTLYSTVVDLLARAHGPEARLISLYSPPYEPRSPSPQDAAHSPTPPRAQAPSPDS